MVSNYHRVLRVSAFVIAFVLMFESGILSPVSKELADNAIMYVASSVTGVYASIAPTELNTITAALTAKQKELDNREALLNARTIAGRDFSSNSGNSTTTYILSLILFILTVLILLNYAMDWSRMRSLNHERQGT